jgi:hypothetical protein
MTQPDFQSAFRNLLHDPLPPAPDPQRMAFELFRRDQLRTRLLALLSIVFWVVGTAGMFLLVFSLNRLVMDAQVHTSGLVLEQSGGSADRFIHLNLPPIAFTKICAVVEVSAVALLIAAMLTVALVFSSRQATLNRINLSLMQISERLIASRPVPPDQIQPPGAEGSWYSIPPAGRWSVSSILIKLLLALVLLLLVGMPAMWVAAKASAERAALQARDAALAESRSRGHVSPFDAVRWNGTTPHVRVGGKWCELIMINELSAAQIVARCQAADPQHWKARFEKDLFEVLNRSGRPTGAATLLEVKDLQTGQIKTIADPPRPADTRPSDDQ